MTTDAQRLQEALHAAKAQGILPADATLPEDESPSWIILVLSFFGAQLVIWPFLFFLQMTLGWILSSPDGALAVGALLLAAGIAMLRSGEKGMFFTQLAFNVLLAGMGVWCWGLMEHRLDAWFAPALAASLLAVAFAVSVPWVRTLLGMAFAAAFAHMDLFELLGTPTGAGAGLADFLAMPLWLLCGVWWLWCALEPRWGGAAWALKAHAFMGGVGAGLLLFVCWGLARNTWVMGNFGSADVFGSGAAALFHFNGQTLVSCLLALAAGLWLVWRLECLPVQHARGSAAAAPLRAWLSPERALWLALYGLWAVLAFVIPNMGVLAVMFTVAWGTGRRRMLALALFVLLAQLSSFYYALQWPLAHKAALLLAVGAVLALALAAMHLWARHAEASHAAGAGNQGDARIVRTMQRTLWLQRAGLAFVAVLAVVLTQWDAMKKEQVLAQGQKIYMPLMPLDPRSIMQGDYMALNFDLPSQLVWGDEKSPDAQRRLWLDPLQGTALMVAKLDEKGIAALQRRYLPNEALGADEVIVPLKYMKGDWVVVTNAYFFPEGHGRVFNNARYGEFRVLGKGKVLLAGLADEKLQRIEPQPDASGPLGTESNAPELPEE